LTDLGSEVVSRKRSKKGANRSKGWFSRERKPRSLLKGVEAIARKSPKFLYQKAFMLRYKNLRAAKERRR